MRINKKLRYGGLSLIFTAVTVAIVVLINVLVGTLFARFDVKLDLSENKLYSIEDSTSEFLNGLDDKIDIIFTSPESIFTSTTEFNQVNEIAKKFEAASGNVVLSYIDLLTNPSFSGEHGGDVTSSSIVVKSQNTGRYKVLNQLDYLEVVYYSPYGEVLTYDQAQLYYTMYGSVYTDVSSAAEQALLSAVMQVSDAEPVRVAFTAGFGEGEVYNSSDFISFLEKNTYTTEKIDMNMTAEISDEIDFLVIFYPGADYTEEAINKIAAWLDNKGNYGKNLFYIPSLHVVETPVLDAFAAEWGLRAEKGFIAQTNSEYFPAGDPYVQYVTVTDNDYTLSLASGRFSGMYIRPITQLFTERNAFTTKALMTTYDGAVMRPFDSADDWTPDPADRTVLNIAVQSEKMRYDGLDPLISRFFIFGNPYNFDSGTFDAAQYSNADFYISIFNTLSGREQGVVIKSKSYQMTMFEITAEQSGAIAMVFCIALPVLVIALGIFVYVRRRFK